MDNNAYSNIMISSDIQSSQYESVGKALRGNAQLKGPNSIDYIPSEEYDRRIQEIIRCKNDIIYFANNYFKIISPGKGLHNISLYEKQEGLLNHFINSSRSITCASRQVGKCLSFLTPIKIRHKSLKFNIVIPIGLLYFIVKIKNILSRHLCFL